MSMLYLFLVLCLRIQYLLNWLCHLFIEQIETNKTKTNKKKKHHFCRSRPVKVNCVI